ncbi:prepilin-type N-terminal cleavage/methylation domain-containing protein [Proteinivorax hydrogeniformans]|uniref:Prepilin-type N-terminal cleavage/methylation domain-containing protein n=1 Tax=Proteinivorax hydrogeniformans TaxID=1826727 RepID=A0AAU8HR82_9FIRM
MLDRKGLTLIEVIISMALISIALITFLGAFGQGILLTSRGAELTQETFKHQGKIENEILNIKDDFANEAENPALDDLEITVFQGEYKSDVRVREISQHIRGNRYFKVLVSNVPIMEAQAPKVDLEVSLYPENQFPWYDNIENIRGEYRIHSSPVVFQNRIRWYRSKEEPENTKKMYTNPSFPGGYEYFGEIEEEQPNDFLKIQYLSQGDINFIGNRFYYFEARPYTLAGRLGHFRNSERMLILNRAGSQEWQKLIEDVYFENENISFRENDTIYAEVMQNPNHPTLNLDWKENKDPQGPLLTTPLPQYSEDAFSHTTKVKWQLDPRALSADLEQHGIGVFIGENDNKGTMMTFDVQNEQLRIDSITNNQYSGEIKSINLLSDERFEPFRDQGKFDWDKTYQLELVSRKVTEGTEIFATLLYEDVSGGVVKSECIGFTSNHKFSHVGFKAFSSENYIPNFHSEVHNQYDRNYAAHFYDMKVQAEHWEDGASHGFYQGGGNSSNIRDGANAYDKNILMDRENTKATGNETTIKANCLQFSKRTNLEISNNNTLMIKVNEGVIFDTKITFGNNSSKIIIEPTEKTPIFVNFESLESLKLKVNDRIIETNGLTSITINNGDKLEITKK